MLTKSRLSKKHLLGRNISGPVCRAAALEQDLVLQGLSLDLGIQADGQLPQQMDNCPSNSSL